MTSTHAPIHVNITFRNTDSTESLKSYATDKITKCLEKFVHHPTEVHTILRVEKTRQIAEATFHADGHDFRASEETEDLYASIDKLVDAITHQVRKHKEKLKSHHA